MIDLEKN